MTHPDEDLPRLTHRARRVLAELLNAPDQPHYISQLWRRLYLSDTTVRTIIGRFVSYGWVKNDYAPGTAVWEIWLTPAGKRVGREALDLAGTTDVPAGRKSSLPDLEASNPELAAAVREMLGWDEDGRPSGAR